MKTKTLEGRLEPIRFLMRKLSEEIKDGLPPHDVDCTPREKALREIAISLNDDDFHAVGFSLSDIKRLEGDVNGH